jgi:hypothetical protein
MGQGEYRVVEHRNPERGRSLCGPEGSSEGSANSLGVPGAASLYNLFFSGRVAVPCLFHLFLASCLVYLFLAQPDTPTAAHRVHTIPHASHGRTTYEPLRHQSPRTSGHHTAAGHTTKLRRLACSYSSMSKRFSSVSCAYALSLPSPPPQVNRGGFRCRTSGKLAYFASVSFQTRAQVSLWIESKWQKVMTASQSKSGNVWIYSYSTGYTGCTWSPLTLSYTPGFRGTHGSRPISFTHARIFTSKLLIGATRQAECT